MLDKLDDAYPRTVLGAKSGPKQASGHHLHYIYALSEAAPPMTHLRGVLAVCSVTVAPCRTALFETNTTKIVVRACVRVG